MVSTMTKAENLFANDLLLSKGGGLVLNIGEGQVGFWTLKYLPNLLCAYDETIISVTGRLLELSYTEVLYWSYSHVFEGVVCNDNNLWKIYSGRLVLTYQF